MQREFSVLAEGRHIFGRRPNSRAAKPGHYKDLTETENRARKVSGTQGRGSVSSLGIFCSLPCGGGVCRRAVNQKPVACDRPTD